MRLRLSGGLLLFALLVGLGFLGAEWFIIAPGAPGDVPGWLLSFAYFVGPLLALGLLLVGALLALYHLVILVRTRPQTSLQALSTVTAYVIVALIPIGALRASGALRLHRLQSLTRIAGPGILEAVQQQLASDSPSVPSLHIRGCTELVPRRSQSSLELQAECARGMGNWDQLVFRPDSFPTAFPVDRTERWGRWSYFWD
jgi:hypothetical protein